MKAGIAIDPGEIEKLRRFVESEGLNNGIRITEEHFVPQYDSIHVRFEIEPGQEGLLYHLGRLMAMESEVPA